MKQISKEDAELMFRKLAEDGSSVFCIGTLWGWKLMLRGTIVLSHPSEITMRADGGGFTLRLDEDDSAFWYAEPGKMSLPESIEIPAGAQDAACISVALPLRVRPTAMADLVLNKTAPFREKLVFLEMKGELKAAI